MGMYTEIFFRAEVDEEAFRLLARAIVDDYLIKQDHPLFDKPRAKRLFRGNSAYFPGANHTVVEVDPFIKDLRCVSFRASLKNYDGEIEAFFDWIRPHVITKGFIGYSLYEEDTEPTLYYAGEERA